MRPPLPPLPHTPKFSVITVSFNQGEFIEQNIQSVLAQNYDNFEHIIVDGGSSDSTLSVLKKYPHLKWTSEPDRGQSHALNKGFARASGDIIAWINSDDWLPPNIFAEIAELLRDYPLIMGACQLTDKFGQFTELCANVPRNWFDILKYWIYNSSPSQPSIYFRSALFPLVATPDGKILDEDLDYCMDYDFFLRISQHYPLSRRIDKTLSLYRNYDTNKTGQDMASVYREMSRVYSRHNITMSQAEHKLSFLMMGNGITERDVTTIKDLHSQSLHDFELIFVDGQDDRALARKTKRHILELDRIGLGFPVRHISAPFDSWTKRLSHAVQASRAQLIVTLPPEASFHPSFVFEASNLFQNDQIGLAIPTRNNSALFEMVAAPSQGVHNFQLQSLFAPTRELEHFVARKVALLEAFGTGNGTISIGGCRRLFLWMLYKGWHCSVHNELESKVAFTHDQFQEELEGVLNIYILAQTISDIDKNLSQDEFGLRRIQNGFGFTFPKETVEKARDLLRKGPENWFEEGQYQDEKRLGALLASHAQFAPTWYFLAKLFAQRGDETSLSQAQNKFQELRELEAI